MSGSRARIACSLRGALRCLAITSNPVAVTLQPDCKAGEKRGCHQHPPGCAHRGRPEMTTDQTTQPGTATEPAPIDMDTLMAFVGQVVGDLGATIAAGNVLVGERLGLYKAVAGGASDAHSV